MKPVPRGLLKGGWQTVSTHKFGRRPEESIIGTLQYMAPEQLEGKPADGRTDIFAFGAVLYEMVTGTRAFEGKTRASLITAIMSTDPPVLSSLQTVTPRVLDHVVQTCLSKDPDERWGVAGDVERQLSWIAANRDDLVRVRTASTRPNRERAVMGAALLLVFVTSGVAIWSAKQTQPAAAVTRLVLDMPPGHHLLEGFHPIAFAPDGTGVVYAATPKDERDSQLFRQLFDRFDPVPIPETNGARDPFFSPDGEWVGFIVGDTLTRVSLQTGVVLSILEGIAVFRGASWASDDTIVFSDLNSGLFRISASGGTAESLADLDARGLHRYPFVLPDGQGVLFTVGLGESASLAMLSFETGEWRTLGRGIGPKYLGTGHLAYAFQGDVRLMPFDPADPSASGDPLAVLRDVHSAIGFGAPVFAGSRTGSLAYVSGRVRGRLMWVDRTGEATPFDERHDIAWLPRLAPDGTRLATTFFRVDGGLHGWVVDIERGTRNRLHAGGNSMVPVWAPDGLRVAFSSNESGRWETVWKSSDGSGSEQRVPFPDRGEGSTFASSWLPDGKSLAASVREPNGDWRSWLLPLDGEPTPLWQGPHNHWGPAFSPDGNWVVYVSNESGRPEVYVRAYPEPGRTFVISNAGGTEPRWSRDSRELFYRNDDRMMVVPITLNPTFEAGAPRVLFQGEYMFSTSIVRAPWRQGFPNYDVSLDGQRFLMVQRDPSSIPRRINVVKNWFEELKRLVPTDK